MDTNIRIQRYTYMHAYMSSYIKTSPPIITSTTDKGENDIHSFIQSGYLYSASLSPQALPTTVIDSVGVYTTKHTRTTGNRIQYIQYIISVRIAGGLGVQPPPHLADPLPQVKIRPRGVEFQPPT